MLPWKSDKGNGGKACAGGFGRYLWMLPILLLGCLLLFFGQSEKAEKTSSSDSYETRLESQTEELCSSVRGVGKCRVMISFSRGETKEMKGSVVVSVTPPEVAAVTVVCEGAQNDEVRAMLTEMLTSLFNIGSHRVRILPAK